MGEWQSLGFVQGACAAAALRKQAQLLHLLLLFPLEARSLPPVAQMTR